MQYERQNHLKNDGGCLKRLDHLRYQRNENKTDERRNLFSSSFNLNVEVLKELIIGGEIGIASSCDPETKTGPAFFALGANYNMGRYLTIDGGLKLGLNKYEIDHSFILGFTIKF